MLQIKKNIPVSNRILKNKVLSLLPFSVRSFDYIWERVFSYPRLKATILWLIKILVITIAGWFIYHKIFVHKNPEELLIFFNAVISTTNSLFYFLFALLLMPVNWIIEAFKWKYVVSKIEKITTIHAAKAVITGVTVSIFTPHRIGEFTGRICYLSPGKRITGAMATMVGSMSQLLITSVAGAVALFFFLLKVEKWYYYNLSIVVFILMFFLTLSLFLYFNIPAFMNYFSKKPSLHFIFKYASAFKQYSANHLFYILLFSSLRYGIFTTQFYLFLQLFDVQINLLDALQYIALIFFSLAAVPAGIITDIGLRELISLHFLGHISTNTLGIISASFTLWLVNLVIPATLGAFLLLRLRLFGK